MVELAHGVGKAALRRRFGRPPELAAGHSPVAGRATCACPAPGAARPAGRRLPLDGLGEEPPEAAVRLQVRAGP